MHDHFHVYLVMCLFIYFFNKHIIPGNITQPTDLTAPRENEGTEKEAPSISG